MPGNIRNAQFDTTPMFLRVGANHLYFNYLAADSINHRPPGVACLWQGIDAVRHDASPDPQVILRHCIGDQKPSTPTRTPAFSIACSIESIRT